MFNFGRENTSSIAKWWRNIDKEILFLFIFLFLLGLFFSFSSTSSVVGEKIIGSVSGAVAQITSRVSATIVEIAYLTQNKFKKVLLIVFRILFPQKVYLSQKLVLP